MLAKEFRLPYRQRLTYPQTLKHSLFLIKSSRSDNISPRFGVIIAKKIDKRATARNRMRRLLQDFITSHLTDFPERRDYLFIVTRSFTEFDQKSIAELESLVTNI